MYRLRDGVCCGANFEPEKFFPFLKQGGVFSPLRDEATFRNSLTVMNGTVAWDLEGTRNASACIDLNPCELYDNCPSAADPLQEVI